MEAMLRIHLMQQCYNLRDPQILEAVKSHLREQGMSMKEATNNKK